MKTKDKLDELGVQETKFYYNDDITVCLLIKDKEVVARGISICSPLDNFVKKTGRAKALGRAIQAVSRGEDSGVIRHTFRKKYDHPMLHRAWEVYGVKSCYLPSLYAQEQRIVNNGKNKENSS